MDIHFLPQTDEIFWIKTAWTLLSVQAQVSPASLQVLETEVTDLSRAAVAFMSNLGFIKILSSITKESKILFPSYFQQMFHWVYYCRQVRCSWIMKNVKNLKIVPKRCISLLRTEHSRFYLQESWTAWLILLWH